MGCGELNTPISLRTGGRRSHAILLLGGNKTGRWEHWYKTAVPEADDLYDAHLKELTEDALPPQNNAPTKGPRMPAAKSYDGLHAKVTARPGAAKRLAALREETLAEIGLYELRRSRNQSQTDLASTLQISQSAISQIERGDDLKVSTLRTYVEGLGADLQLVALFDTDDEQISVPIRIGAHVRPAELA